MERIMNDDNDWDHNMEEDAVDGPEEAVQALNEMRT